MHRRARSNQRASKYVTHFSEKIVFDDIFLQMFVTFLIIMIFFLTIQF